MNAVDTMEKVATRRNRRRSFDTSRVGFLKGRKMVKLRESRGMLAEMTVGTLLHKLPATLSPGAFESGDIII